MIFILLISLYTSRIVLSTLGVEDFGVYEVVGGAVSLFSILSASLSTAISRFITFSLGKDDLEESTKVYSTAIIIQAIMAVGIGLLIELIGVWYLHHGMNLPAGRMDAAFWVLQCSIVTFGLSLISVPYDAEIVAHEDMKVYAYFSILDAVIALLIVLLLRVLPADKLIVYAVLNLLASLLMRFLYAVYCRRHYPECRFIPTFEKRLLKEIGSFTGWHLLGESVWIINNQGINLLLNSYFGVTLNAARGVATRVNGLISKFSGNFMIALSPQITKTYAENDLKAMHALIFRGTKLSFYLMLVLALPMMLEAPILLRLWLKVVPDQAVLLSRLSIVSSLIIVLGTPLVKAQLATGKLKRYQIVISLCTILVFPISWIAYSLGASAEWTYHIFNTVYFITLFVRIYLVKDLIDLPWRKFLVDVYLRVFVVALVSAVIPYVIFRLQPESVARMLEVTATSVLSVAGAVYLIGLNQEERAGVRAVAGKYLGKLRPSRP